MNEIETTNMSKELLQFCDNLKRNGKYNMANDNLYELKSVDINGNVIDRKFGVNVVTNYGMFYYNKTTAGAEYHISVGTGTGTPTTADTELFNKLDWVNVRSNTNKVSLPLRYDATTGIISSTRQVLEAYFDYNITGVDSPTNITEFGMINYDNGSLTTHSLVYDEQGNPSFIIKNPNERLYITVYFVTNFKEDLINDAWDNDCYAIIGDYNTDVSVGTTSTFYRNIIWTDYNRGNSNILTGSGSTNPRFFTTTRETIVDENDDGNTIVNENTLIDLDIQGSDKSIAGFSLTQPKGYQASGFRITKRLKLQTPEQITLPYMIPSRPDSKSFEYLFGHVDKVTGSTANNYIYGKYALTDYNMETLMTYNVETHEWDIPVPFSSPSNCDYCNYFDSPTRIYVNFNGDRYMSVYFNINLNLPISAFNYVEYPIYATDKYWDTSTYEIIPDVSNIPIELRNKKYYITEVNNVTLVPTTETHEIIPHKESRIIEETISISPPSDTSTFRSSEQHHWVINQSRIYFMSEDETSVEYVYSILPGYRRRPLFYTTGDIFIYWHDSKFNIVDTTTPSVQPVSEDFVLDFGTGVDVGTPMFTFTDRGSGYVVCQHLTENKTVIVDLHGDTENNRPTQYLIENTKHCNAILCTKYCVYQRSDITDVHTFEIYDMETQTVVDTFSITHTTNAVLGIRAWSKFIYVAITGVRPVLYRMDDKSIATILANITGTFFETKYLNEPPTLAVDECMVFHSFTSTAYYVFSYDNPLSYLRITPTSASHYISGLNRIEFNGGIKILMTIQNAEAPCVIYDIGLCIGERLTSYYGVFNRNGDGGTYDFSRMLLYHNKGFLDMSGGILSWYPIEQSLLCRATGTTRTVQSMNNRKNIKQPFSFKTTNDPNLWSIT